MSERETADARPQAMSAERLAEIRRGMLYGWYGGIGDSAYRVIGELLTEQNRQSEVIAAAARLMKRYFEDHDRREAAAMEIVRAVASASSVTQVIYVGSKEPYVSAVMPRRAIDQARALLASTPATDGGKTKGERG